MAGHAESIPLLLARSVRRGLGRGLPRRAVLRQVHDIGNQSLLLVVGGMLFFGAVMVAHGAYQARRLVGDLSLVGPPYFQLMVAELGPTVAGLLAAIRAGAAISAELAAMRITEQIDALELSAGDPYSDLVAPRILGGLIALPCLVVAGTMASLLSAAVVATLLYGADGRAFLDPSLMSHGDLLSFSVKALLYGLFIPLMACHAGLAARGGPGAVGEATTRGVVAAALACIAVDLSVGGLLFLVQGR